jgi:anti-sigma-K factor RskA
MMDHDELRSLIPAYALGAVPQDEMGVIRDHILSCDECMAEADRLSEATGSLALAVEPVALPDGFADRVMAEARPEPEDAPALRVVPSRWQRWSALIAAVATGAALVLGVLYLNARNDLAGERDLLRAAEVLAFEEGLTLQGDGVVAKAVTFDDERNVFAATGLDEAPEGKTYELWLMRGPGCPSTTAADCEVASAGTFEVSDGVGLLELQEAPGEWEYAAVTIEQDGGADDGPTTAPVAANFSA